MNPDTPVEPLSGFVNVTILDLYSDSEILMGAYQFQNPRITGGSASTGTQGMPLRLIGEYLTGTTQVLFDTINASFSTVNDGLMVTVPNHPNGQVTVIASDALQNESFFLFTYQNPTLSNQNLSGPQRSVTQIIGEYLENTSQVTFNGTPVPFDPTPTVINVSVPDGTENASVVVEDLYGNKRYTRFEYKNPNASYVFPDNGPKNMPVTIFGSYLQNIVSVDFGMSTVYPNPTEKSISLTVPDSFGNEFILTDRYANTTQVSFTYKYTFLYGILNAFNEPDNFGTQNKPIRIYGTYLVNTSRVLFGNTPASFQYLFNETTESESLEVIVPPSEGNVSVRVIDRYLNEIVEPFSYQNSRVHSFSPTGTTGWPLTLYGEYLQACTVLFNGEDWNPIITQNTVTATVRPGSGNVSFQITDAYNNWIPVSGVFQYRNPQLTALSASSGRAGRILTLTGDNLSNTSKVSIGSMVYPLSTLDKLVQIQVPDYHGQVTVIAYDRYDASCEIGPFYAMGQEPTLVSVNPSRGPNHSPLTIYGTNLSYTSRVYLGQNLSFQKTTNTILTNASVGNASVIQVYDEANELLTIPFTYTNPLLQTVNPSTGTNQTKVILRGEYLNHTSTVYVQNTSITFQVISDEVRITMPDRSGHVSIELVDDLGNRTSGSFLYQPTVLYPPSDEPQRKPIRLYGERLSNTSTVIFNGSSISFEATENYLSVVVPDGNVSTTIEAIDRLNNRVSTTFYYQNPTALSVTPREGPYHSPLVLSGQYLTNTSFVRFGPTNVSFVLIAGDLHVSVPESTGDIYVTDQYTNTVIYPFVYKNPRIDYPPGEPKRKVIQLYGENLSNTSFVSFNGSSVPFQATANYVEVTVPDGNLYAYILVRDRWNNTDIKPFYYFNPIAVSIIPSEGPRNMPVIVRGEYLTNTSTVKFGGVNASFSVVGEDLLIRVPDSSGNVLVTDPYNNQTSISFTYKNPVLYSLNPSMGPPRRYVELRGDNLSNTSTITFGTYNVSFERINDGLRLIAPDQEGDVVVQATDSFGNNVSSRYLYRNPRITQVNPSVGRTNRYTKIYGENLRDCVVFFGDKQGVLETSTITDNLLHVVIPEYYGNVSVYARDPYGNTAYWDRTFLCLGGDPALYGISPTYGPTKTQINLSGENLSSTVRVTIGNNASFTIESSKNILANAPEGVGDAHVVVTDILEEDVLYLGTFQYQNPKITSITPSTGTKNTLINISGDFLNNTSLFFRGLPTTIQDFSFRIPDGSGNASFESRDMLGNRSIFNGFTYQNPNISSLSLLEGPAQTPLRIHGIYLENTSEVRFGTEPAEIIHYNDQWIDVTVPNGSSRVVVQVLDQLNNTVSIDGFTYKNPKLLAFSPSEGIQNTSTRILGQNLQGTSYVYINGITPIPFSLQGDEIEINVPSGEGSFFVTVEDLYGNVVELYEYTYRNPKVTGIYPSTGPKNSSFRLLGENLSGIAHVQMGTNVSFSRVSGEIEVKVPPLDGYDFVRTTDFFQNEMASYVFIYQNPTIRPPNPVARNTSTQILGEFLENTLTVTYDGVPTSFVAYSDRIDLQTASSNVSTIEVTDIYGNVAVTKMAYLPFLEISSGTPSTGTRGTILTLTGNVSITQSVIFDNTSASFYLDGENLNIIAPIHPDGNVQVTLQGPSQSEATYPFTYQNPKITYVIPVEAPSNSEMSIYGRYLQNTSQITFDGTNASFSKTSTGLTVIIPQVPSNFSDPSGNTSSIANVSNASTRVIVSDLYDNREEFTFNYQNPRLFAMSPLEGVEGTTITVQGEYLQNTSYVLFGPWNAPILEFTASTIILSAPLVLENVSVTSIDRYGNRSTVPSSFTPLPFIRSTTCFPAGTTVATDQGLVQIQKLIVGTHTIHGRAIEAVTCTLSMDTEMVLIEKEALRKRTPTCDTLISRRHKVYYKGKLVSAQRLVGKPGIKFVPYTGVPLYNVVCPGRMKVHGMICETLDPSNPIASHFK